VGGGEPEQHPRTSGGDAERPRSRFTITAVYAAFGFLTAVVGFAFLVDPALRPDPRERQEASLAAVAVDQGITFRGYAERIGAARAPQALDEGACVPGSVVYLRISLAGFKDRETRVRYLTFDANTHKRVDDPINRFGQALRIRSDVPSDQSVSPQWVQWPFGNGSGSYFLRFELSRGNNLLAVADTDPFKVSTTKYVKLFNQCLDERKKKHHSEGPGFQEASLTTGGGGFDTARWLTYAFAVGAAGVIGAGIYSLVVRLRSRRTLD
jgi:hypothetical protein